MSFRAHKFNAGQFMYKSKRNFQVKKYIYVHQFPLYKIYTSLLSVLRSNFATYVWNSYTCNTHDKQRNVLSINRTKGNMNIHKNVYNNKISE